MARLTRRALLAGLGTAALAGCSSPAGEDGDATATATPTDATTTAAPANRVAAEPVASGFTSPVGVAFPPGETTPYVVDQAGTVERVGDGGATTVLDVTDRMVPVSGYSEMGLLGLAFHPDYARNRRLFVRYSAPPLDSFPDWASHTAVLAEFTATEDGAIRPDSERRLLEVLEPQSNHNGGDLAFGPDGYLYVALGDGGGAGDAGQGHVSDWYATNEGGNGQDVTENLLGSLLRLDVDGGDPYAVPDDNPLVGADGLDEHYAWGLRNPWRFSFDGDDLYVADVGQNRFEEIDRVVKGGNYGWNVREGHQCYGNVQCPDETPDGDPLREPVVAYPHQSETGPSGVAVVGGYVSRGDALPGLAGDYVFGDWAADGTLFAATPGEWEPRLLDLVPDGTPAPGGRLLAFGRDARDALYVCTSQRATVAGTTGAVHRLVAP